jgi:hypothetical protein
MAQSPALEIVRIKNVAGTFAMITWDDLGGIFTYEIQKSANGGDYIAVDFTNNSEYFDQHVTPNTKYIYRVRAVSTEYTPSDWTLSEEFTTFASNSYVVTSQASVSIYQNFINEKLIKANGSFDFNKDEIDGVLIKEGFVFDNKKINIAELEGYILYQDESLKLYGDVSEACGDRYKLLPAYFNDMFFSFERLQSIVRYSKNNAASWILHRGILGRVGNPVGTQVAVTSDDAMYIMGYDGIYTLTFSTDVKWSNNEITLSSVTQTFSPGNTGTFRISKLIDLPPGLGLGSIEAITIDEAGAVLYVASANTVYSLELKKLNLDIGGNRVWNTVAVSVTGDTTNNVLIKSLVCFGDSVYAFVPGTRSTTGVALDSGYKVAPSDYEGVYKIASDLTSSVRVFGNTTYDRITLDPVISNLSRSPTHILIDGINRPYDVIADDGSVEPSTPGYGVGSVDPERVDYAVKYAIDPNNIVTNNRGYRTPLRSDDGTTWVTREENYHYESQYLWFAGNRMWVNYKAKLALISKRTDFVHTLTNTSETLDNGKFTFYADSFNISGFPGYVIGMVFYKKSTGDIIGYYSLGFRTRDNAIFTWTPNRQVATAILASNVIDAVVPDETPTNESDIVPPLDPMVYQFLPEHFIQNEPLYVSFVEEYLNFLSSDRKSDYGQLYNLIQNHDVNETEYLEMFYNDLSKRNVYLDTAKWKELLKFVNNRASDLYSIKGVKDSYKFLFKLLYNEEVTVTTETDSQYEYDIIIASDNLTSDLVGNRLTSSTGYGDVVYYDRYFDTNGTAYWQVTLNNIIGEFDEGGTLSATVNPAFTGTVIRGVVGKEAPLDSQDYLRRGPTYYAISIYSQMQVSKYRDDVLRFVHPVGFGFVGIMMITMFVNSGVSTKHQETLIDILQTLKWDMGLPRKYPMTIPDLDTNGKYKLTQYGEIQTIAHPLAGQDFPLRPAYMADNPQVIDGQDSDERRKDSFLFDSSNLRFINTRKLVNLRLKDGLTQRKDS